MKKIDPRVRLLIIICITTLAIIYQSTIYMLVLSLLSILLTMVLKGDLGLVARRLKKIIYLLVSISVVQVIFVRTGFVVLNIDNFVLVYSDGLFRGLNSAMRFFIIICSAAIVTGDSSRRMTASLSAMNIPYSFVFMLMTALRFIPIFTSSFSDAMTAIRLRGVEPKKIKMGKKIKLYSNLLLPVVADAVIKAQNIAVSMEARGFRSQKERTQYLQLKLSKIDIAAIFVICLVFTSALYIYMKGL